MNLTGLGRIPQMHRFHKIAVLGAGTMGARIAAHFANAGVPAYLLDIVPPGTDSSARNKIAAAGLDAALTSKPAAFFESSLASMVTIGNFEDDLKKLAEVDWIIEAVVENLDIKRDLLKKVEAVRPASREDSGRLLRRLSPVLVRNALLQSPALHAATRDHSHARD